MVAERLFIFVSILKLQVVIQLNLSIEDVYLTLLLFTYLLRNRFDGCQVVAQSATFM